MSRTRRISPLQPGAALTLASVLLLTGCQFKGAASLPLPGGAAAKNFYRVTVEFPDVLDLVPQSAVKVNDVTVGRVESIALKGYTAVVVVRVEDAVSLPANARASLRQTSLLGEKFVSLDAPTTEAPTGKLASGALIPLARTSRNTEIEEVLSALSLVLNGGSLEQIQVINKELVAALKGREGKVKDLLTQLNVFVGGLDQQKGEIVRALDSLDRLSARLADQRDILAVGLRDLPAGAQVLTDQRAELTKVLTGLDSLGTVAVRVINGSQQNTVADLKALQPVLAQLNAAGTALPNALELLTTYPFPKTVDQGIKGDYANLYISLDLNLTETAKNLGVPLPAPLAGVTSGSPSVPGTAPSPARPLSSGPLPPSPSLRLPGLSLLSAGSTNLAGLLLRGLS